MALPAGFVDTREAARITNLHRNTVYAAAKRGEIPGAVRIGERGRWRFTVAGLRKWLGIEDDAA